MFLGADESVTLKGYLSKECIETYISKIGELLTSKYFAIKDALKQLGDITSIRNSFIMISQSSVKQ